jgi:adenine-specific DNA methylase/O-acetyl-ADP-ribose deacetylase (regulator of RNase III)
MLKFTSGDMFKTPADIRVNTVNCVGVMGAGVALAFKDKYPEMFKDYKEACDRGDIRPGKLHVWKNLIGDWVINFPTKRHWRDKSHYEDIEAGLIALRKFLNSNRGVSVALPALGCGHGGLDWTKVRGLIERHLDGVDAEILVFRPSDSRAIGQAVYEKNATELKSSWQSVPVRRVALSDADAVMLAGDEVLLFQCKALVATSSKPERKEEDAALSCVQALVRPEVTIAVCGGTKLARLTSDAAIQAGAKVLLWVAEGIDHYRPSRDLLARVSAGQVAVASIARPGQRWNPTLARQTLFAACRHSEAVLVTDPRPDWFPKSPLATSTACTRLFYTNYEHLDVSLRNYLQDCHAHPIGRRAGSGSPNVDALLEALLQANPPSTPPQAHRDPDPAAPDSGIMTAVSAPSVEERAPIPQSLPNSSMPNSYPKRLIEVDLPIRRISAHARREKSIRHGHISTLHIWWARRPLAACRAVICAALWPDPADENCPAAFRAMAAELMYRWARESMAHHSIDSHLGFTLIRQHTSAFALGQHPTTVRKALLDFIADFANWDNSTVTEFLETSRALTAIAHYALSTPEQLERRGIEWPGFTEWERTITDIKRAASAHARPLVVDPFAGGGSIPLEALRVGADAFASDLNPVPVLLNKVVLEYIPKYGQHLADEVRKWGEWIKCEAEKELAEFYPKDPDGATPIAYLWARTIQCEGPGCGAQIPLIRSFWIAKGGKRATALTLDVDSRRKQVEFRIVENAQQADVPPGTVQRGSATCPVCGYTTPIQRVRGQAKQHGLKSVMTAKLVKTANAVVWRAATAADIRVIREAGIASKALRTRTRNGLTVVPDEAVSPNPHSVNRLPMYGIDRWGDVFGDRQLLVLVTFQQLVLDVQKRITDPDLSRAVVTCLALSASKLANYFSSLCVWRVARTCVAQVFGRQALPMTWDYGEMYPFAGSAGDWSEALSYLEMLINHVRNTCTVAGQAIQADATVASLPDDSADLLCTDPPYYDAVSYADLSDYCYVWLRRMLLKQHESLFEAETTDKLRELIVEASPAVGPKKTNAFYENGMRLAFIEGRKVCKPLGLGVVVFAHRATAAWESLLQSMIASGWQITASWPIDTERPGKLAGVGQARLMSSIHLVCRPRENPDGSVRSDEIGDWRDVLRELPRRIHEWMPRLAEEGVVGADAIFACLGPALEIFSRYSRVEKSSGDPVSLKDYLEHVWAAVSKEALSVIFEGANTEGFEPDARLTAMWLWTLAGPAKDSNGAENEEEEETDEEDEGTGKRSKKKGGFALEYDAARKIAQGLGAHLEDLRSMVEVSGETARLLPVAERTVYLFGKEQADEPMATKRRKKLDLQPDLFTELAQEGVSEKVWAEKTVSKIGETTLDRIHQGMILFATSRSEALKRFLVDDGAGDQRFWRLAQALSALYPPKSDEKRWVDGVLARKKGLGL